MADRLCPDCHHPLAAHPYHNVSLDLCPACHGAWFDGGELDKLRTLPGVLLSIERDLAPQIVHQPHVSTDRWCPVCPQPLQRFAYSAGGGVVVDGCPKCGGVWALQEEIDKMRAWVAEHSLDRALRPYRPNDEAALAIAQFTQQHEDFMARAHAFTEMCRMMDHRFGYRRRW